MLSTLDRKIQKHEELDCILHHILELQNTGSIVGVINSCITIVIVITIVVNNSQTTYRKVDSFLQNTVRKPHFVSGNNNENRNGHEKTLQICTVLMFKIWGQVKILIFMQSFIQFWGLKFMPPKNLKLLITYLLHELF